VTETPATPAASAIPSCFIGAARRLTEQDIEAAARRLGCEPAIIRSVIEVEAGGDGFLIDGRPAILFEAHVFSKLTGHRFDRNPMYGNVSSRTWNRALYGRAGTHQYERLALAMTADAEAALKSASWGAFQIMGWHAPALGYGTVRAFVEKMKESEAEHLSAFCAFVEKNNLAEALRRKNWAGFAKGYNGASYAINKYHTKLAVAYHRYSKSAAVSVEYNPNSRILRPGDRGSDVVALKRELNAHGAFPPLAVEDGTPGRDLFDDATAAAVRAFQKRTGGLAIDGVAGPLTWQALNGGSAWPGAETLAPPARLAGYYRKYRAVDQAAWAARYPDFSPREIACKGDGSLLIDERALDMLQALRDAIGKPLVIASGYRGEAYNRQIGGAPRSLHLMGQAFDVSLKALDPAVLEAAARRAGFKGFGFYRRFMHIDARGTPFEWGQRWWR
jgi:hypothetical protein